MDSSDGGSFFYANMCEMAFSVYDCTLRFVRNGAAPGLAPGTTTTKALRMGECTVSMSPSHAKAMIAPLLNAVREYERQHGKIPVDAKEQAAYDAISKAGGGS